MVCSELLLSLSEWGTLGIPGSGRKTISARRASRRLGSDGGNEAGSSRLGLAEWEKGFRVKAGGIQSIVSGARDRHTTTIAVSSLWRFTATAWVLEIASYKTQSVARCSEIFHREQPVAFPTSPVSECVVKKTPAPSFHSSYISLCPSPSFLFQISFRPSSTHLDSQRQHLPPNHPSFTSFLVGVTSLCNPHLVSSHRVSTPCLANANAQDMGIDGTSDEAWWKSAFFFGPCLYVEGSEIWVRKDSGRLGSRGYLVRLRMAAGACGNDSQAVFFPWWGEIWSVKISSFMDGI